MILEIIIDIVLFSGLIILLCLLKENLFNYYKKLDIKGVRNKTEKWLPIEQIKEFKQLFYLLFAALLIIDLYYLIIINRSTNFLITFVIYDLIISILAGVYIFNINKKLKTGILLITLVPFTGLSFTGLSFTGLNYSGFSGGVAISLFIILTIIHILGILYISLLTIEDFRLYSQSNQLGYTIFLLYIVVFVCVIFTTKAENLSLLDSLVYCSNAFTSNGFGLVNATSNLSKIISLVLVWAGYILSGMTTALLTLALVSRYYKKRFVNLKSRIKKQEVQLNEINEKLDLLLEKN